MVEARHGPRKAEPYSTEAAAAGATAIATGTDAAGSAVASCAGCGAVSATEAPPLGFRLRRLRLTARRLRFRLTSTAYAIT